MQGHEKTRARRYRIQKSLFETTFFLEFILAILVICLVVMEIISMVYLFKEHLFDPTVTISYSYFMERALDIVIGVEFLKMLCRHSLDSVVEVLSFAMARHLIVTETSMLEGLICVLAVAVLFVVRKYLFIEKIDKIPELQKTIKLSPSQDEE